MNLHAPRVGLREFRESDASLTHCYEREPHVVRYHSWEPQSFEQSLERVKSAIASSQETPRTVFDLAIIRAQDAHLVGRCGFKITDHEQREAMLWYVSDPNVWGQGYVTEAARALLAFAFEQLSLHRIFVDIDPRNTASLRVAEKLGMRREAHFVENAWVKGEWTDAIIMAILAREHHATRKPLERC